MTIHQFVIANNLRPVDAILLRKKLIGMVDHYAIYLGIMKGRHVFVANYTKGVRVIDDHEMEQFLTRLVPKCIERFNGDERQRQEALQRAISRVGENKYSLMSNNCEHYKNFVHHGVHRSEQVESFNSGMKTAGGVALGALLIAGLFSLFSGEE